MPALGSLPPTSQYFTSLQELDTSVVTAGVSHDNIAPYTPRSHRESDQRGRLLVCHDFKGGYSETPSALHYTFNFWSFCDVFIYFSHHRVTIPPPGWTSAAHRHGAKMLGTLIFEHQESEPDCLRLFFGRLPTAQTGPAVPGPSSDAYQVPVSPHYACILAELARVRGFDGYLLNFEWHLRADGGAGHARALTAWTALLQAELKKQVGQHAEVIWYDSVVFNGQVRWQDRLNAYNLPFFPPSTGFFTNYTWRKDYPALTAAYFSSLDKSLVGPRATHSTSKTLADIYVGLDVWGRGLHGGGKLGTYRALEHIDPTASGLSAALFGQGWTWESQQDMPGFTWSSWWEFDRQFWLGPVDARTTANVVVPPAPLRQGEEECPHGPFRALVDFFERRSPPDPRALTFCTAFSPGIGFAWFVGGRRVLAPSRDGWTDVGVQSSLGDLLWPRPTIAWEDREGDEPVPEALTSVDFDDAWMGGSSVRVAFDVRGSEAEDAFFRCVWVPVQSLRLSPGRPYEARIVFKTTQGKGPAVDLDVGFVFKAVTISSDPEILTTSPTSTAEDLEGGWTAQTLQINVAAECDVHAGLVVGFATEDASLELSFSVVLGQLAVWPSTPPGATPAHPRILWADFKHDGDDKGSGSGALSWDVVAGYPPLALPSAIPGSEDPAPIWRLDDSDGWFPRLAYVNVYALAHGTASGALDPDKALFVGTNGLEGVGGRLRVERGMIPEELGAGDGEIVRFYVQGVTDRGEVVEWARCAFVDAQMPK